MEIIFRRPELDDRETILKHLSERRLRGCERTFANVYLWASEFANYDSRLAFAGTNEVHISIGIGSP